MAEIIIEVLLAAVYIVLSAADIKKREIPVWILGIPVASMTVYLCVIKDFRTLIWNVSAALIFFSAGILISKLTKGAIGNGDAYVCGAVFMILGFLNGLTAVTLGLFSAAFFGTLIKCIRKKSWKYQIPFVPFLCSGYICMVALNCLNR